MSTQLPSTQLRELQKRAHLLKPIMQIGKNGLTETVMSQLQKHLKQKKLIKVRLLKSSFEETQKETIIQEIQQKTQSTLISHVGHMCILYKP